MKAQYKIIKQDELTDKDAHLIYNNLDDAIEMKNILSDGSDDSFLILKIENKHPNN